MAKSEEKKRRLLRVQVDRLGLVDKPAVGDAMFVIAKRETEVPEETEVTEVEKANGSTAREAFIGAIDTLRASATDMDEGGLRVLSELMGYVRYSGDMVDMAEVDQRLGLSKCITEEPIEGTDGTLLKFDFDGRQVELLLDKAGRVLSKSNAANIVAAHKALSSVISSAKLNDDEPAEKSVEPPKPTALDEAAELLEKQAEEQAAREADETQQVLAKLNDAVSEAKSMSSDFHNTVNEFYRDMARARGRVFDDELEPAEA